MFEGTYCKQRRKYQKLVDDSEVAANQGLRAEVMREAMCNTAQNLDEKTAKILHVRQKRYATKKRNTATTPSRDTTSTPSRSSNSIADVSPSPAAAGRRSPAADARGALLNQLNEMVTSQQHGLGQPAMTARQGCATVRGGFSSSFAQSC